MRCWVSLLRRQDPVELLLRHVARPDQQVAEPVLEPARRRLGGDDLAAEKRDRDGVVLALDDEDAGLALQAEHLEDVGQREDLERPLKTHWMTSSPPAGPAPRRTPPGARRRRPSAGAGPRTGRVSGSNSRMSMIAAARPKKNTSAVTAPAPGRSPPNAWDPGASSDTSLRARCLQVSRRLQGPGLRRLLPDVDAFLAESHAGARRAVEGRIAVAAAAVAERPAAALALAGQAAAPQTLEQRPERESGQRRQRPERRRARASRGRRRARAGAGSSAGRSTPRCGGGRGRASSRRARPGKPSASRPRR